MSEVARMEMAIEGLKTIISEKDKEIELCKKVIEERGYAFQEAQNKTLLKNSALEQENEELKNWRQTADEFAIETVHLENKLAKAVEVIKTALIFSSDRNWQVVEWRERTHNQATDFLSESGL